jgi:uncharacterized repeat protein (TIGR02543 family)
MIKKSLKSKLIKVLFIVLLGSLTTINANGYVNSSPVSYLTVTENDLDILINNSSGAVAIETIDWDDNGLIDIFFGDGNVANLVENKDGINFEDPIPLSSSQIKMDFLDINFSGKKELITSKSTGSQGLLYKPVSNTSFLGNENTRNLSFYATEDYIGHDFNQDGFYDFIYLSSNRIGALQTSKDLADNLSTSSLNINITYLDNSFANYYSRLEKADFNNDGKMDFIATGLFDNVYLFINDGYSNNTLNFTRSMISDLYEPEFFQIGDIDRDGDLDIVQIHENNGNRISTLKNNGDGTFETSNSLINTQNVSIWDFALSDMNLDGSLDIVTTINDFSNNSSKLTWFKNDGNGNYLEQTPLVTSFKSMRAVHTEDMNQDGVLDIIVSAINQSNQSKLYLYTTVLVDHSVFYNSDGGDYTPIVEYALKHKIVDSLDPLTSNGRIAFGIDTNLDKIQEAIVFDEDIIQVRSVDYDHDGDMDFLALNDATKSVMLYSNNRDGTFSESTLLTDPNEDSPDFFIVDLNYDQYYDLVFVSTKLNEIVIVFGSSNGLLSGSPVVSSGINDIKEINIIDLGNNGKFDFVGMKDNGIVISELTVSNNQVNFGTQVTISPSITTELTSFDIGDIDFDGLKDIIVGTTSEGILLFKQSSFSPLQFIESIILESDDRISKVVFSKINQDQYLDFYYADETLNLKFATNDQDSTFTNVESLNVSDQVIDIFVSDLTYDGKEDVVLTLMNGKVLTVKNLGRTIVEPSVDPIKRGYDFDNWYTDSILTVTYDFDKNVIEDTTFIAKWILVDYDITYDLDGGINDISNVSTYNINSSKIDFLDPSRNGYQFDGWYDDSSFSNEIESIETNSVGDVALFAKWIPTEYTITYNLDGGTNANNPGTYDIESSTITLLIPTKSGFSFDGWYDDSSFSNEIETINTGSTGNIQLYAKWTLLDFDITYDLDGGTLSTPNASTYNSSQGLALNEPTKTGYIFDGWYDNDTFTGNEIQSIAIGTLGDIDLYAKWQIINYLIEYDLDGGSNDNDNPTSYDVLDTDITLLEASKIGYQFDGWYGDDTFSGNEILTIDVSDLVNIDLYAKFIEIEYDITYQMDLGINSSNNPLIYTVNSNLIILEEPNKTGYSFDGWYLENTYDTQITFIAENSTGDLEIFAKWTINEFNVSFVIGDTLTVQSVDYNQSPTNIIDPTLSGYVFLHWTDGINDYETNDLLQINITDNIVFIAVFESISISTNYDVYIVIDGIITDVQLIEEDEELETIPSDPSKTGYTFEGWYVDGNEVDLTTYTITDNTIIIALFEAVVVPTSYEVVYFIDGVIESEEVISGENVSNVPNAVKTGYTFKEWQIDGTAIDPSSYIVTSNVYMIAIFEKDNTVVTYQVTYINGTEVETTEIEANEGLSEVPTNTNQVGYTFDGWYEGQTKIDVSSYTVTEDIILVAQYIKDPTVTTYEVTYIVSDQIQVETVADQGQLSQIPTQPTKVGHTFNGWSIQGVLTDLENVTVTSDMVIIAVFEALEPQTEYNVSFVVEEEVETEVYEADGYLTTLPTTPSKVGHTFNGWILDGAMVDPLTVQIDKDLIFIASFTAIPNVTVYEVTFIDGRDVSKEDVLENDTLETIPSDPVKLGYLFEGWTLDGQVIDLATYVFTEDTTLFSSYDIDSTQVVYTVIYVYGETSEEEDVLTGGTLSQVPEEEQDDYRIIAWKQNGVEVDITTLTITSNVMLIAEIEIIDPVYHTVFFLTGEATVATEVIEEGSLVTTIPSDPVKSGSTFKGWTLNGVIVNVSSLIINEDVVLQALFEDSSQVVMSYDVYIVIDGIITDVQLIEEDEELETIPSDPSKTGYTFEGWYVDGNEVDLTTYTITDNTIIIALFEAVVVPTSYEVVYFIDGVIESEEVISGENVSNVPNAVKTGYTFKEWQIDGTAIDPSSYIVTSNVYMIAIFEKDNTVVTYQVTYINGTEVETTEIEANEGLSEVPTNTNQVGYTFDGWYEGQTKIDVSSYTVTEDIILVAQYIKDPTVTTYEVTYIVSDQIQVETVADQGQLSQIPTQPTKVGHTFNGWSIQGVLTDLENVTVTSDMVIIAVFEALEPQTEYNVSFVVEEEVETEVYEADGYLTTLPTTPSKVGHTFNGWILDGAMVDPLTVQIDKDLIFIASFTAIPNVTVYEVTFIDGRDVSKEDVLENDTLETIPSDPVKLGYLFEGWTLDGQVIDLATYVFTEDTTLFSSYDIDSTQVVYTVIYVYGETSEEEDVLTGGTLSQVPEEEQDDYRIIAWKQNGVEVDITTLTITSNVMLIAEIEIIDPVYHTVFFLTGEATVATEVIEEGSLVTTIPSDPVKSGSTFKGWTLNGVIVNVSSLIINEDVVLQALFEDNSQVDTPIEVEEEETEDGEKVYTFTEGTATLNGEPYVSGTLISEPGSYELIITDGDRISVYTFNIEDHIAIEVEEEETEDGEKVYTFTEGTATLNGEPYVSGTLISEPGSYELIITDGDRISVYTFNIEDQPQICSINLILWLIFLLIGLIIGYFIRLLFEKRDDHESEILEIETNSNIKVSEDSIVVNESSLKLEDIILKDFESREKFKSNDSVDNGLYLEITNDNESVNRIISIENHQLPSLLMDEHAFIQIEKEEYDQLMITNINMTQYLKKTPGSYVEEGYYIEVDLNNFSLDNIKFVARRLPPTSTKGHRWVKVEKRKIIL